MKKHEGFTLIELLLVIIILGILAAYAIPKYMSIDKEARISVTKGLQGSIKSAAEMVHALAVAKGSVAAGNIDIGQGVQVAVVAGGYPDGTAAGIGATISDITGFTATAGTNTITYKKDGATDPANCSVAYKAPASSTVPPTIDILTSGC